MRLPRVMFTVRRMMVVVAIVALGIEAERIWRRSIYCARVATLNAREEATRLRLDRRPLHRLVTVRHGLATRRDRRSVRRPRAGQETLLSARRVDARRPGDR
jgi:hypothetical protein